jgi:hypothetical protein
MHCVCSEWKGHSTARIVRVAAVPPPSHPCRYLVGRAHAFSMVTFVANDIRLKWTWHDGMRLVVGQGSEFYAMKIIRDGLSIERTDGVLPEL